MIPVFTGRIEADALYNRLGIKTFHFGIGIQFIEV